MKKKTNLISKVRNEVVGDHLFAGERKKKREVDLSTKAGEKGDGLSFFLEGGRLGKKGEGKSPGKKARL